MCFFPENAAPRGPTKARVGRDRVALLGVKPQLPEVARVDLHGADIAYKQTARPAGFLTIQLDSKTVLTVRAKPGPEQNGEALTWMTLLSPSSLISQSMCNTHALQQATGTPETARQSGHWRSTPTPVCSAMQGCTPRTGPVPPRMGLLAAARDGPGTQRSAQRCTYPLPPMLDV